MDLRTAPRSASGFQSAAEKEAWESQQVARESHWQWDVPGQHALGTAAQHCDQEGWVVSQGPR